MYAIRRFSTNIATTKIPTSNSKLYTNIMNYGVLFPMVVGATGGMVYGTLQGCKKYKNEDFAEHCFLTIGNTIIGGFTGATMGLYWPISAVVLYSRMISNEDKNKTSVKKS